MENTQKLTKILFWALIVMVILAIASAFYKFYFQENYDFTVEASCNPTEQRCFVRSCGEEDECPPNELEIYRVFTINAADYKSCNSESCVNECTQGAIQCIELACNESEGENCTFLPGETDL